METQLTKVEVASAQDNRVLADLIFASGKDNLIALFESPGSPKVTDFLRFALSFSDGQFGYNQQYVIRHNDIVIACASCWTNQLSMRFREATLKGLLDFYGLQATRAILSRSETLAELIPAPESDALGLGHISVDKPFRRQGVALRLLQHFVQKAKQDGKRFLSLDVSADNVVAVSTYEAFGFQRVSLHEPQCGGSASLFKAHLHMRYKL